MPGGTTCWGKAFVMTIVDGRIVKNDVNIGQVLAQKRRGKYVLTGRVPERADQTMPVDFQLYRRSGMHPNAKVEKVNVY